MKEEIRAAINESLKTLGIEGVDFVVDFPTDKASGADYFSNVAMVAMRSVVTLYDSHVDTARIIRPDGLVIKSPRDIAEALKGILEGEINCVEKIEVAGPGFLNFTLSRNFFTDTLNVVLQNEATWGRNDSWKGKKVVVEYTDPNPFKEFHIGHLFTNAVGESIARLFMMNGADTKRVNYQGDVGLHVAHAIYGMQQLGITPESDFTARDLGKAYVLGATTYKTDGAAAASIRELNKKIYSREDDSTNSLYDAGRKVSLDYFETIYALVGTEFSEYFFESEAGPRGKELVLNNLVIFPESDGARIYDGESKGLHTRVFLNKEGLPTYEAKELALAKLKDERLKGYDHSVISTANEINEYFKVLLSAMGEVYPDLAAKTEHIGHGTVRLASGKMSSRTGDVIAAIDFIEEVAEAASEKMEKSSGLSDKTLAQDIAIAAIKYATLRGNILQNSVFDKERALSFEGDSGPYLQYTYARICSVLDKATEAGVTKDTKNPITVAYTVEKLIAQFPHVIESALIDRAPHKVTTYLTELAGSFNTFYAHEKIADPSDEYAPYKAAVAKAVAITLKNGLWVLGIKAPERM